MLKGLPLTGVSVLPSILWIYRPHIYYLPTFYTLHLLSQHLDSNTSLLQENNDEAKTALRPTFLPPTPFLV